MLEIVFGESAAGALKIAQGFGRGKYAGGCTSLCILHRDGSAATEAEIEQKRRELEAQQRRKWQEAVPVEGDARDVFVFPLALSYGDISRENFWEGRRAVLRELHFVHPGMDVELEESVDRARRELERLLDRAQTEAARIWYSDMPDEASGMHWMLSQLEGRCDAVYLVKLPELETSETSLRRMAGWGEVEPETWGGHQARMQLAAPLLRRALANHWRELQAENAPLRAVLNGQLRSAAENLYDYYIEAEIDAQPEEFHQARAIVGVLRHGLGVSDGLIALRMEKMIREGRLAALTQSEEGDFSYRRMLKKCGS